MGTTLIRIRVPNDMLERLRSVSHDLAFDGNLSQTVLHCTRVGLMQAESSIAASKGNRGVDTLAQVMKGLIEAEKALEGASGLPSSTNLDTMAVSPDKIAGETWEEGEGEGEGEGNDES